MINLNYPTPEASKPRTAYRIRVPGLHVLLKGLDKNLSVRDISATGIAVYVGEDVVAEHSEQVLDLVLANTPVLKGVSARIVRYVDEGVVALRFNELDHRQEATLDKLVLEVQKRFINFRKSKPQNGPQQSQDEMVQEVLEETLKVSSPPNDEQ